MRVSCNPDDPGYGEFLRLGGPGSIRATLNGEPQRFAFTCETGRLGWVERYIENAAGYIQLINHEPQTERVYGSVEVQFVAEAKPGEKS